MVHPCTPLGLDKLLSEYTQFHDSCCQLYASIVQLDYTKSTEDQYSEDKQMHKNNMVSNIPGTK